jgi:hypothetical protein
MVNGAAATLMAPGYTSSEPLPWPANEPSLPFPLPRIAPFPSGSQVDVASCVLITGWLAQMPQFTTAVPLQPPVCEPGRQRSEPAHEFRDGSGRNDPRCGARSSSSSRQMPIRAKGTIWISLPPGGTGTGSCRRQHQQQRVEEGGRWCCRWCWQMRLSLFSLELLCKPKEL